MIYDVQYFINKFTAIPEERWGILYLVNDKDQMCAQGLCGLRSHNCDIVWDNESADQIPENLLEAHSLYWMFKRHSLHLPRINNEPDTKYPQPTPKQRILAALADIKLMQEENNKAVNHAEPEVEPQLTPEPLPPKKEIEYRVVKVDSAILDQTKEFVHN